MNRVEAILNGGYIKLEHLYVGVVMQQFALNDCTQRKE